MPKEFFTLADRTQFTSDRKWNTNFYIRAGDFMYISNLLDSVRERVKVLMVSLPKMINKKSVAISVTFLLLLKLNQLSWW